MSWDPESACGGAMPSLKENMMSENRLVVAYKIARDRRDQKRRAAQFAREMARSVFGAVYVDDARQAEIRRASDPKRPSPIKRPRRG